MCCKCDALFGFLLDFKMHLCPQEKEPVFQSGKCFYLISFLTIVIQFSINSHWDMSVMMFFNCWLKLQLYLIKKIIFPHWINLARKFSSLIKMKLFKILNLMAVVLFPLLDSDQTSWHERKLSAVSLHFTYLALPIRLLARCLIPWHLFTSLQRQVCVSPRWSLYVVLRVVKNLSFNMPGLMRL